MFLILGVIVQIVKFWEHGNTFCGMKFTTWYNPRYSHAVAKGCGTRVCMYIFMGVCTCPRARLWYGTMQRLQVLDSWESTNEHKTCQQPWEDGRVSTELLVRPVFTLYRGSRCGSQGAQTTYQTDRSTRIHFC